MATIGLSDVSGNISLPTRQEITNMLRHPIVAGLAVFMAGLVVLGAIGSITFLAFNGKGTEAIGGLVLGILGLVLGRINGRLHKIDAQTNGTTSRLLDAALPAKETIQ